MAEEKPSRDCGQQAKRAVAAHERRMHRGKRPTFRTRRGSNRK